MQSLRGFGLDHEPPIDDHIEHLPGDRLPSPVNGNTELSLNAVPFCPQFHLEGARVDVFPKSEPESLMDFIEGSDDRVCQRLLQHSALAFVAHPLNPFDPLTPYHRIVDV